MVLKKKQDRHKSVLVQLHKMAAQRATAKERENFARFLPSFTASLSSKDLDAMRIERIYHHVYALFSHVCASKKGEINLSISNPHQQGTTYIYLVLANTPFTVASVLNIFAANEVYIYSQQNFVVKVGYKRRKLVLLGSGEDEAMVMRFVVEPLSEQEIRDSESAILATCHSLRRANMDWLAMEARLHSAIEDYVAVAGKRKRSMDARSIKLVEWIKERRCIFLGYCQRRADSLNPSAALGICRVQVQSEELRTGLAKIPPRPGIHFLKVPVHSMIHRPVYMDMITIGIRSDSTAGFIEHRFIILYAFDFFNESLEKIPYLSERLHFLMEKFNVQPASYRGRVLRYAMSSYPRDQLVQILDQGELVELARNMLEAFSYTTFRSFFYYSRERLFANLVVIIPRDNYDSQVRARIERVLLDLLQVEKSDFNVFFTESRMAFVFFAFPLNEREPPKIDQLALAEELSQIGVSWRYQLRAALLKRYGEEEGIRLHKKYSEVFPAGYRDSFSAAQASCDLEPLLSMDKMDLHISLLPSDDGYHYILRLFDRLSGLNLSKLVHLLENMGVVPIASNPYPFQGAMGQFRLVEFRLDIRQDRTEIKDWQAFKRTIEENIAACYRELTENDGFNRLTLATMSYKDISLLRAWTSYLIQVQGLYGRDHIEEALVDNPSCARLLIDYFYTRFAPQHKLHKKDKKKPTDHAQWDGNFLACLEQVSSLEQDQILRYIYELIGAIDRTNFYVSTGILSFKLYPRRLSFLKEPPPFIEVFVYSADFEGMHLRNGLRARGGIRWSDRRASYRQEIYDLFQAQIIKNAIIVPTGAKGGFYIKNATYSPAAIYRQFISALLALTDNLKTKIIHPPDLRIYDEKDAYLVVAPDKGTAGFSDLANEIAQEHDYWLDDAFASSGSSGYNHKDMGITARGAWESVKRSCAEMGIDADRDGIEVIGVGDMSGDVFGNAMLLSAQLKLIAAFDHRHIFIDPAPDPALSFRERKRLFRLTRSSWADYKVLSPGGGVYARTAKKITLSAAARKKLGIKQKSIVPQRLIHHLLQARVDLLWFGGIGTYVRSRYESDPEVGDKANDGVRIEARSLKAKVIGEGANLGMTMAARIEFAVRGGKVATDSNDNSGGVHCSDREVNIKILLSLMEKRGDLSRARRNILLKNMTADVARQVLAGNYTQNLCLSLENWQAENFYAYHAELVQSLAAEVPLHAATSQVLNRFTRPQLAALLGYYKNRLKETFGVHNLLANPLLRQQLPHYYPARLSRRAGLLITRHPLANPILTVRIVNNMVDNLGLMLDLLAVDAGQLPKWAQCFYQLDDIFSFIELARSLASSASLYPRLMPILFELRRSYARSMHWAMHAQIPARKKWVFAPVVQECTRLVPTSALFKDDYKRCLSIGIEERHAAQCALALEADILLILIPLAHKYKVPLETALALAHSLTDALRLRRLKQELQSMQGQNKWRRMLSQELLLSLNKQLKGLIEMLLAQSREEWQRENEGILGEYRRALDESGEDIGADLIQFLLGLMRKIGRTYPTG